MKEDGKNAPLPDFDDDRVVLKDDLSTLTEGLDLSIAIETVDEVPVLHIYLLSDNDISIILKRYKQQTRKGSYLNNSMCENLCQKIAFEKMYRDSNKSDQWETFHQESITGGELSVPWINK